MISSQYIKDNTLATSSITIDINKFVNFLKNNTHITKLILRCSSINYEGIKELAKLVHLTSLDLGGNEIGDEGTEALGSGNLTNLITLKVYDNSINYRGIQTLASGNLVRLTSLIYNDCSIDETLPKNVLPELKRKCSKRKIGEEPDSKLSEAQTSLHFDSKGFKAI